MKFFKCFFVAVILFFLVLNFALALEVRNYNELAQENEFLISIDGKIDSEANKVDVYLYFFPKEDINQEVNIQTNPNSSIGEEIIFNFQGHGEKNFNVVASVKENFLIREIRDKASVNYVLEDIAEKNLSSYTLFYDYINVDDYIKNKAKQLENKEDVFETLFNLAEYVKKTMVYNIEYPDLKKATDILQSKTGVCSHYSILFLSLARSLGLAGKYVYGFVYSVEKGKFIEHAWTEIWIPEEGWVPFDLTYGQYGWIDSNHIKFGDFEDAGNPSVRYVYQGLITAHDLDYSINTIKQSGFFKLNIPVKIKALEEEVGFESYVPLEVEIENPYDYYLSLPLHVSVAPGIYGVNDKRILLKPNSKSKIYFVIYIPEIKKCIEGCVATLEVQDFFMNSDSTTIKIAKRFPALDLEQAKILLENSGKESSNYLESNIDIFCKSVSDYYYINEFQEIKCIFFSSEQSKDFEACIITQNQECVDIALQNQQKEEYTFKINPGTFNGPTIVCPFLKDKETNEIIANCVKLNILEKPNIDFVLINSSDTKYGDVSNLEVRLNSNSNLQTKIEIIDLNGKVMLEKELNLNPGTNLLFIKLKTNKLNIGNNDLLFKISFEDKNGELIENSNEFSLNVLDVPFYKKILIWITNFLEIL